MSTKKDKFSNKDKKFMKLAINLAKARKGLTGENPSVGCLIVKDNNTTLKETKMQLFLQRFSFLQVQEVMLHFLLWVMVVET